MSGVMKKITLSFNVLAAIVAATILQACASRWATQCVCAKPTLTPSSANGPAGNTITVTIATRRRGLICDTRSMVLHRLADHRLTARVIKSQSGTVPVPIPTVFGRTLKLQAIAFKAGMHRFADRSRTLHGVDSKLPSPRSHD